MIFHYHKHKREIEVLNDLVEIHNDRIAGYELALSQSKTIESELQDEFNRIITDTYEYKQQLVQKIKELHGDAKKGLTIFGKVYRLWMDLKVVFACGTRKAILASCQYNEEIALHVYNAALAGNMDIRADIRSMLEIQEANLRETLILIKSYKEMHFFREKGLMYFN